MVGAIVGGLDNGSITRGWYGGCGTSGIDMRYGYDMAWYGRVEGSLRD